MLRPNQIPSASAASQCTAQWPCPGLFLKLWLRYEGWAAALWHCGACVGLSELEYTQFCAHHLSVSCCIAPKLHRVLYALAVAAADGRL